MKELFLDANAHLPMNHYAAYMYQNIACRHLGHPSSLSKPGREAAEKIEFSRAKIAKLLGAQKPEQIIFTSTCTQAAEWGLFLLKNIIDDEVVQPVIGATKDKNPLTSNLEHAAVRDAATKSFENFDSLVTLKNDKEGTVIWKINNLPNYQYKKCICVHAQNELGTIQPIKELKSTCKYLFSDVSQSIGKIPVNLTELEVDIAIISAHKFGGPASLGILYLKDTKHWKSFGTGSRYFMDRPGTPDVASIVATEVALDNALLTLPWRTEKMLRFQNYVEEQLEKRNIEVLGKEAKRLPNTTFLSLPGRAAKTLLDLEKFGIYVGLGSACGSMHSGISPTVKALGGREGTAQDYMRISQWGEYGLEEAKYFIEYLDKVL